MGMPNQRSIANIHGELMKEGVRPLAIRRHLEMPSFVQIEEELISRNQRFYKGNMLEDIIKDLKNLKTRLNEANINAENSESLSDLRRLIDFLEERLNICKNKSSINKNYLSRPKTVGFPMEFRCMLEISNEKQRQLTDVKIPKILNNLQGWLKDRVISEEEYNKLCQRITAIRKQLILEQRIIENAITLYRVYAK